MIVVGGTKLVLHDNDSPACVFQKKIEEVTTDAMFTCLEFQRQSEFAREHVEVRVKPRREVSRLASRPAGLAATRSSRPNRSSSSIGRARQRTSEAATHRPRLLYALATCQSTLQRRFSHYAHFVFETKNPPVSGRFSNGSDGTRTRDLRRDRPVRRSRRATTTPDERSHLQGFLLGRFSGYRMASWIVQPAFGPRVGHEMLAYKQTRRRWRNSRLTTSRPLRTLEVWRGKCAVSAGPRGPQESRKLEATPETIAAAAKCG